MPLARFSPPAMAMPCTHKTHLNQGRPITTQQHTLQCPCFFMTDCCNQHNTHQQRPIQKTTFKFNFFHTNPREGSTPVDREYLDSELKKLREQMKSMRPTPQKVNREDWCNKRGSSNSVHAPRGHQVRSASGPFRRVDRGWRNRLNSLAPDAIPHLRESNLAELSNHYDSTCIASSYVHIVGNLFAVPTQIVHSCDCPNTHHRTQPSAHTLSTQSSSKET